MNRCDICGKFRKVEDLYDDEAIDYEGNETYWFECGKCIEKEKEELKNDAIQSALSA